jgi:hypothetical protein
VLDGWRPSAGILDTRSVKTGPQRGPRGFDAGKKVKGRKRVPLVDTLGSVHAAQVVPASMRDRGTPAAIEPELAASAPPKVWADLAFNGEAATAPMDDPLRHQPRAGRAQAQGRFRGRAQASDGGSSRPSRRLAATDGSWSTTKAAPSCRAR